MMSFLIEFVNNTLIPFGAFGIFVGSVLEEVVAIIPSAVVSMGAGFFFLTDAHGWLFVSRLITHVILPVTFGVAVGSLPVYLLSYWIGEPFLEKWGRWFGVYKQDMDKLHDLYRRSKLDEYIIFIARIIPFVPSVSVAFFAGITRIPFRSYILATLAGIPFRAVFFGLVGWQLGYIYMRHLAMFDRYDSYVLYGLIILFVLFVAYRKFMEKRGDSVVE